jgi:hypothetical protein
VQASAPSWPRLRTDRGPAPSIREVGLLGLRRGIRTRRSRGWRRSELIRPGGGLFDQALPSRSAERHSDEDGRERALRRIDALLTDPASVLPSSAWAVREARAYVNPPPKDASYLLSLLPARAADVLSDKNRTRFDGEVVDASRDPRKGGIVVLGRSATYCSKLTTEEARELVEALSGLRRNPGFGHNSLAYRVGEMVTGGSEANIWFEPYFPHGRFHFPPGG